MNTTFIIWDIESWNNSWKCCIFIIWDTFFDTRFLRIGRYQRFQICRCPSATHGVSYATGGGMEAMRQDKTLFQDLSEKEVNRVEEKQKSGELIVGK